MAAFAGESQARNKYTYYAAKAKQDGFEQIAALFEETAHNEKEHAEIWFNLLHGAAAPTALNLEDAAKGENYEWTQMYAEFAQVAREEGVPCIDLNTLIADIYDEMGQEAVKACFTEADWTHTSEKGARINARVVSEQIQQMPKCKLRKLLK